MVEWKVKWVAPCILREKDSRRERERNVVAKDICRENSCEPVCCWKFRKCMYRCQTAGSDVDDPSRRMRATLVSPGFSMHVECTGGETLFTSYALATTRIGNLRCALAVALREKCLPLERDVYTIRCQQWKTFSRRWFSLWSILTRLHYSSERSHIRSKLLKPRKLLIVIFHYITLIYASLLLCILIAATEWTQKNHL